MVMEGAAVLGVGSAFAGYRIQGVLGQGGMGTVYLAQHPRLPRSVALKLLNREVSTDPELTRRFEREADVIARLEHPGIVGVIDRGADDGHLWIAMEYVRGTDAASWDASAQPPATVLGLLAGVASALDYAHSRGVLHRDVKPANILIAQGDDFREARAVITDFGIAGVVDSTDTKITATGTFTATLAYGSPEQLSGAVVDHRSDQYSLACTLFALLAGQPPYAATNPGEVVVGHLTKPVPRITTVRPDLPTALDALLERAMAKQREQRFPTCTEFIAAARDALEGRRIADTVDYARIAPTAHNSAPVGYRQAAEVNPPHSAWPPPNSGPGPMQYGSAAPGPGRGSPNGPYARAPRRRSPVVPAVIIGLVVVLICVATAVSIVLSAAAEDPWAEAQTTQNAFPDLVPEAGPSEPGWREVSCRSSGIDSGEITCHHAGNEVIVFVIKDFGDQAAVEAELGSDKLHSSGLEPEIEDVNRPAPNPTLDIPAKMTVPYEYSSVRGVDGYNAFFSFPADRDRSRYLIMVKAPGHTADELLRDWWSQAPLGK
ncbi:serine/threonine-protein kinase [Nocardia sp. NPDC019395]|uniref:serine/threonine-protein kinase n=1 Tax=Nocardia sp. NPDC019395 TaxID=3154686 RepID=UPI0033FC797F